jgi:hypothetical protein
MQRNDSPFSAYARINICIKILSEWCMYYAGQLQRNDFSAIWRHTVREWSKPALWIIWTKMDNTIMAVITVTRLRKVAFARLLHQVLRLTEVVSHLRHPCIHLVWCVMMTLSVAHVHEDQYWTWGKDWLRILLYSDSCASTMNLVGLYASVPCLRFLICLYAMVSLFACIVLHWHI